MPVSGDFCMDSQNGKKKKSSRKSVDSQPEITDTKTTQCEDPADSVVFQFPLLALTDLVIYPGALTIIKTTSEDQVKAVMAGMHEKEYVMAIPMIPQPSFSALEKSDINSYYKMGTQTRIIKLIRVEDEPEPTWQITMRGENRMKLEGIAIDRTKKFCRAVVSPVEDIPLAIIGEAVYEDQTLLRTVRQSAKNYFERCQIAPNNLKELLRLLEQIRSAATLSDFISAHIDMPYPQHAALLATLDVRERLQLLLNIISSQLEVVKLVANAAQKVRTDLDKQQRDYFIRQHIKALKEQLSDEPNSDTDDLKEKLDKLDASKEVIDYIQKQWKRLQYLPQVSAEYSAARTHIETLLDIPWHKYTQDHISLTDARRILDEDHYGLQDVKNRILEHLAVLALRKDLKAPIICLYGPPGVGKTSIGKSIARALGRKFERISLGGIHDEYEIRGHRRTYIASMPGRIVQALRHAQSMNPVMLLDEIDKLSNDMHGDPSSALLEVLDPEQHNAFVDNYIETPIDLSQVLFITTANSLDTIPGPLRDRMEIIELHSYTHVDKRFIASDFLIPKLLKEHGLTKSNLVISPETLDQIISHYTREAGVRQLEQKLSSLCRKVAAKVVEALEDGKKRPRISINTRHLESYLGKKQYDFDLIEPNRLPGISTGLAWTPVGGDILFIETNQMPGKGELVLTGQLGNVMQESAKAAMTLIRSHAQNYGFNAEDLEKRNIHLHVPAGATPKDGPSAGCAIFTAIYSLLKDISVPAQIAMTGEISLRGAVLPVGGIREKVLAAHRSGIRTIILPEKNIRDLDEVHESVRNDLLFIPISNIDQLIPAVFG